MYSTIDTKYGLCVDCADGIEKPIIAGRCKFYHYSIYRKKLMLEKQKEKAKVRSLIQQPKNRAILAEKGIIQSDDLELWFLHRMNTLEPICANCGNRGNFLLDVKYKKLWRSCQAHLFPKRHFKSIKSHPLNGLVLGTGFSGLCNCHDTYDSSWDAASKMHIWPEVVNRFKILYPLINTSEHKFIPQILLDTLLPNS